MMLCCCLEVVLKKCVLQACDSDKSISAGAGIYQGAYQNLLQGRYLQRNVPLGRNVYSFNLSLYTQVANVAEGNAGMALELRQGLEAVLSKFIEKRTKEELQILLSMNLPVFRM